MMLSLLMPGEIIEKIVTAHQIPVGVNTAQKTLNVGWC